MNNILTVRLSFAKSEGFDFDQKLHILDEALRMCKEGYPNSILEYGYIDFDDDANIEQLIFEAFIDGRKIA